MNDSSSAILYHDHDVMDELANQVCDDMGEFLKVLGVRLRPSGKVFAGRCPLCGRGRGGEAFRIYPWGQARGYWKSLVCECHLGYPKTLAGFVRAVLEAEKGGRVTHKEAVDKILEILGVASIGDIHVDREAADRRRFQGMVERLNGPSKDYATLCERSAFLRMVRIPDPVFIERGHPPATLESFEVGVCRHPSSPEYGRTVFPVYDPLGSYIVGALSRSPHPKCTSCKLAHPPDLGCRKADEERVLHLRWRTLGDFSDKQHLYGLWKARHFIRETETVIFVEGAADVLRAHEAGVRNVVGLFGTNIHPAQKGLLIEMNPRRYVLCLDNDRAGRAATEEIAREMEIRGQVVKLCPPAKDLAEMSAEAVREFLGAFR